VDVRVGLPIFWLADFDTFAFKEIFSEFISVSDVEILSVESDVHSQVDIFPVPVVALIVFGQSLSFDQFALWHSRVFNVWLNDRNTVVLQVVVDLHWPHPEVFCWGFVYRLLIEGAEF